MIQISYRALLIAGLLIGLFNLDKFNYLGELPGWAVLLIIAIYQLPWSLRFWLPGQKKKFQKRIDELLMQQQQQAVFNEMPTIKPEQWN